MRDTLLRPSSSDLLSRRRVIQRGLLGAAAITVGRGSLCVMGAEDTAGGASVSAGEEFIPFLDPQPLALGKATLHWDTLTDWITPMDQFFGVQHYGVPKDAAEGYKLECTGLLDKPRTLTLDDLKKLPKKEITATLECSGNGASKTFMGAIGNAKWTGTPLAPLLSECGLAAEAVEIAFWGADHKSEKIRDAEYDQNFARSLSIADALRDEVILAYEMNGEPLAAGHGAPIRLIVPGWYGIAWVKWLTRIEARDHRLMNRFMARDYVTVRGRELPDGHVNWQESSVGPMNLKSMVAKVARRKDGISVRGAAWSGLTPLKAVEVKIDDGEWLAAKIDDSHTEPYTWRFWTIVLKDPKPSEYTLVSRAIDAKGNIQPAQEDAAIKLKKTYWEANQQWPRRIKISS